MKVKTTIHVFFCKYSWETEGEYLAFFAKVDDDEHRTYVGQQEIEIEVPDNYDPTAQKLAALEKEKEQAQKEFARKVASINERISKLQALEFTA